MHALILGKNAKSVRLLIDFTEQKHYNKDNAENRKMGLYMKRGVIWQ